MGPSTKDMDAVLDAALDELDDNSSSGGDDDDVEEEFCANSSCVVETKPPTKQSQNILTQTAKSETPRENRHSPTVSCSSDTTDFAAESKWFQSALHEFIEACDDDGDTDAFLGKFMDQVQSRLPSSESSKGKAAFSGNGSPNKASADGNVVDETISSLLEGMAKVNMDGNASTEDDLLKSMFNGLDPGSFNADAMLDGMVEQLLSKDLMYEPMKQVTELFPNWLKENHPKLSPDEYDKRCKQCDCFQKLVKIYETNPENVSGLLDLMQKVQEYGQPPQDIINKIAPGLELDENGMPKMNLGNLPFGENEECCVM